ncbi:MAG: hypothetical protein GY940_01375 [bacterium]|nr:hypothetical protein [bacterium]
MKMDEPGSYPLGHVASVQDVKFDLEPYVAEYQSGIRIHWAYAKELFSPGTVEYMTSEYSRLADFFAKNPDKSYRDYLDDCQGEDPDDESEYTFTRS